MINNITLVGRAGKDPEIKNFQSGAQVARVTMACTRPTKEKETDWFEIQIWGNQAKVAKDYIKKGHLFGVTGSLREEKWEKDGVKHSKVVVAAQSIRLLHQKSAGGSGDAKSGDGDSNDFFGDDGETSF